MAITNKVLEFTLELTPGGIPPIIHASQGDIGRTFKANVVWNGSAASAYISGTTVKLRGKKPDKTVFDYSATLSGSAVTFATTEQMTIISGPVECELVFTSGDDVVATANFILAVEDSPWNPDALSESEVNTLAELVSDQIPPAVEDWLDDHPEATTTVQDGAITKAKINTAFLPEIENAYVTPEMFGAKGDGTTDDTAAVKAAFSAVVENGYNLLALAQYKISDTITITASGNTSRTVIVQGMLLPTFDNKPAVVIIAPQGWNIHINTTGTTYFGGFDFVTDNAYHYGALPNVGLLLRNASRCKVSGYIRNFNVGLRLEGLNGGSTYNDTRGVSVWNCAYGTELYASTSGWVNSNIFNASTFSTNSGVTNRDKAVPIHIFSSYNYPNNCNIFEGDYMSVTPAPTVLIENGLYNRFLLRNESGSPYMVDNGGFNYFHTNYASNVKVDGFNGSINAIYDILRNTYTKIVDIDADNVDVVKWRAGESGYYARGADGLDYGTYTSGAFQNVSYGTQDTSLSDGVIEPELGAFIKLGDNKSIAVQIESSVVSDVRYLYYLFDNNKNLITDPINHYIRASIGGALYQPSGYYRLQTGSNSNNTLKIDTFTNDVAYVFITTAQKWNKLTIYAESNDNSKSLNPPCQTHLTNTPKYPYYPINNEYIRTSKPYIGKRLYSTIDGAEYVCTAITDGVETWTKKIV